MCLKWADGKEAGTSEAADGPGVDDDVLGLEAQAVDGKLDHHIHGIGLILPGTALPAGRRAKSGLCQHQRPAHLSLPTWTPPAATYDRQRRCRRKGW